MIQGHGKSSTDQDIRYRIIPTGGLISFHGSGPSKFSRILLFLTLTISLFFRSEAAADNRPFPPHMLYSNTLSTSEIEMKWQNQSLPGQINAATGFIVERRVMNQANWTPIATLGVATNYVDKNLPVGQCYFHRVIAVNAYGQSAPSDDVKSCTMPTAVKPAAPSELTAKLVAPNRIDLSWKDNSNNELGFEIYIAYQYKYEGVSEKKKIGPNMTQYSYISSIEPEDEYTFIVFSYNNNEYPGESNHVKLITMPSAPQTLKATAVGPNRIDLSWENTSYKATSIKIERKLPFHEFTEWNFLSASATSASDTELPDGVTRSYRVTACNSSGCSAFSNVATAQTEVTGTPSNLTATALSSEAIKLVWQDNSNNETGFDIQRKPQTGNIWNNIKTVAPNATTYWDAGLLQDMTYYYRVGTHGSNKFSDPASATTTKADIPNIPADFKAIPLSSRKINLSWKDNSDHETGFVIERKSSGLPYKDVANLPANSVAFQDSGLAPFTTYTYRMKARDNNVYSDCTQEITATTLKYIPLAAPANLKAEALSDSEIKLSWIDKSTNESGFFIEANLGNGTQTSISLGPNTTDYLHVNLKPLTTYRYRVKAVNPDESSSFSNEALAKTKALTVKNSHDVATASIASQPRVMMKSDITCTKGMKFDSKAPTSLLPEAPWGGMVTVKQEQAESLANGKCIFHVSYPITNRGTVATSPTFTNRIRNGQTILWERSGFSLNAGETRQVDGRIPLAPGIQTLTLSLDDDRGVDESEEKNNTFNLTVKVEGDCKPHRAITTPMSSPGSVHSRSLP